MSILQKIKLNKYQLKSDFTGSIWLEEDDPKSRQLNLDFGESNRSTEDQREYHRMQGSNRKTSWIKGLTRESIRYAPKMWPFGHIFVVDPRQKSQIHRNLERYEGAFAPLIFRRSPLFCISYKYLQSFSVQRTIRQRRILRIVSF